MNVFSKRQISTQMRQSISQHSKLDKGDKRCRVERIAPDINTYRNSVTVLVGAQGSGKTYYCMREAIAISRAMPTLHLIITVTRKDQDPTVEGTRPLVDVPILSITYEDAVDTVTAIIEAKHAYNEIKREGAKRNIPNADLVHHAKNAQEFLDLLQIEDFERPWLDTIIILDDVGSADILKNPASEFNTWFKLCRDINCMFFLAIHDFKELIPVIRRNTAIIVLCRGLGNQQLAIIRHQANTGLGYHEIVDAYGAMRSIENMRYVVIDCIDGKTTTE